MAKYYGNIKGERAENGDQGLEGETEKGETKKERERERESKNYIGIYGGREQKRRQ